MFKNAVNLVEILGFKIRIDPSWLVIAALIVWTLSTAYFPDRLPGYSSADYFLLGLVAMIGLFASLILHELSHSLVARRFGLEVGGITLFIFGGVAELQQDPDSAHSEFWIAIAGPVMSLGLSAGFYLISMIIGLAADPGPAGALFRYLGLVNLVLAIFNLVPAFPLDGGRILRAMIWWIRNDLIAATRIASICGSAFGIFLITTGLLSLFAGQLIGGAWQMLIGFFIIGASRSSLQQILIKRTLTGHTVRTLMTDAPHVIGAHSTVQELVEGVMLRHHVSFVPVLSGDRLLGYVDLAATQALDRALWPQTRVDSIMIGTDDTNTIKPDTPAQALFETLSSSGRRKMLVAAAGKLYGVISLSDLISYLSIRQKLGLG